MKLKIQRMSGLPADPEDARKFDEEFRVGYVAAETKNAKSTNENGTINLMSVDMLSMQADVQVLEESLREKYKIQGECDFPVNAEAWQALIKQYGSALMLAPSRANPEELILVVMDVPLD
jgi:hypothetical protein